MSLLLGSAGLMKLPAAAGGSDVMPAGLGDFSNASAWTIYYPAQVNVTGGELVASGTVTAGLVHTYSSTSHYIPVSASTAYAYDIEVTRDGDAASCDIRLLAECYDSGNSFLGYPTYDGGSAVATLSSGTGVKAGPSFTTLASTAKLRMEIRIETTNADKDFDNLRLIPS